MTTSTVPIPRFNVGEVDPAMRGRLDLAQYTASAQEARNVVVLPHGGFRRRAGSRFIAEIKDSARKSRLVPFVYSNTDAYALEFGGEYIRFFADGGQLYAEEVDTAIVNGDFANDINGWTNASGSGIDDGDPPEPPVTGNTTPSAPTNLRITGYTGLGDDRFTTSWETPASIGTSPIQSYHTRLAVRRPPPLTGIVDYGLWTDRGLVLSWTTILPHPLGTVAVGMSVLARNASGFGRFTTRFSDE